MTHDYERRHSKWYEKILLGLPFHLVAGLPLVVGLPSLERWGWGFWYYLPDVRINTVTATVAAFVATVLTLRRMSRFPGAQAAAYIAPAVSVMFLLAVAMLFFTREEYSRQVLFFGYCVALLWCFVGYFVGRRYRRLKLAVTPFGDTRKLLGTTQVDLRWLETPDLDGVRVDGVVADLRADDLPAEWERFLAACTLCRIPVYHIKQIHESISGRVRIDRLSENEFGSLMPSLTYGFFKRGTDLMAALLFMPVLLPVLAVVAVFVRLDSHGPAFFLQPRMGFRGRQFRMYKFRSMYHESDGGEYTRADGDPRITRVGRFIRKYRIDELPQVFNVLRGEMSFIGPRPESVALSKKYGQEVPFFSYRHVVRPGISGWAQVEQGYAAEADGMGKKLQYDFYYIKHFSLWIDVLIVFKTLKTILTGFGAR